MEVDRASRAVTSTLSRGRIVRPIGALLTFVGVMTAALAVPNPAGATGFLPPNNPPANIAPQVNVVCSGADDTSSACTNSVLHDINYGRLLEGVPPMVLPYGYAQMTVPQQLLVVANLERGARGLGQVAGLSDGMDGAAQNGANASSDPAGPPGVAWGSNWAGDVSTLDADFNWMYNDGPGGFNLDCQGSNYSGCWGHRANVLGPWNGTMGAGFVAAGPYGGSYAEVFAWGTSYPLSFPYSWVTYPPSVAPDVVQISPKFAAAPGAGTPVTIEGNYFSLFSGGQTPTVEFGSSPATNVHVNWDGELVADAPADPNGFGADTVVVTVTTPAGTSDGTPGSAATTFTYTPPPGPAVAGLSPSSGLKTGGTQVVISGANFTGVTGVSFGGVPATSYLVNSSSSITAVAPAAANFGAVNVVVTTNPGGASGTSSHALFTYALGPTSTAVAVDPTSTAPGASVTYWATVSNAGMVPTGTVTFQIGQTILCTTAALVNGSGSCSATTAPAGADTVWATYSGNANLAASIGTTTLVVTPVGAFNSLTPTRICDTRPGNPSNLTAPSTQCNGAGNAGSTVAAGGTKIITVAGYFGVPADATAVILNVTAVSPGASGYFTVYPTGTPQPVASNVNYATGEIVPNLVEVTTGTNGDISIFSSSAANIVVDVESYISSTDGSDSGAGLYTPLSSPVRICDTRAGNISDLTGSAAQCNGVDDAGTRLSPHQTISVQVTGEGTIPAGASAAVLNVTAVDPSASGYFTVFPQGGATPTVSNLNFADGQTTANRVIVPLSSNGKISIYSSASADVVVDVSGYYSGSGGGGATFSAEPQPVRICDSRPGNISNLFGAAAQCNGLNNSGEISGPDQSRSIQVTGLAGVPTDATAVVVNVTAVSPSASTYLTVFPGATVPNVSDLNPSAGEIRANLCVATVNPDGTISINNHDGDVNLVVDVMGWYS